MQLTGPRGCAPVHTPPDCQDPHQLVAPQRLGHLREHMQTLWPTSSACSSTKPFASLKRFCPALVSNAAALYAATPACKTPGERRRQERGEYNAARLAHEPQWRDPFGRLQLSGATAPEALKWKCGSHDRTCAAQDHMVPPRAQQLERSETSFDHHAEAVSFCCGHIKYGKCGEKRLTALLGC